MNALSDKLKKLDDIIASYGSLAIAFSGGMDSSFLLLRARKIPGVAVTAVTARSSIFPSEEAAISTELCRKLGIKHITVNLGSDFFDKIRYNGADVCYTCKKAMFTAMKDAVSPLPLADGTNGDEPGLPLKQTTSFEESVARANLADTWSFIESDLQAALSGITAPLVSGGKRRVWRGTTAAVHAFAARYYLYRGDYANALAQVEAVLEETSTLKDYNDPAQMSYFPTPDEYEINEWQ